jgi:hypothetical protein
MDLGRRKVSVNAKPFKRQAIYPSVQCPVPSLLLVWRLITNCFSEATQKKGSKHTFYRYWLIVIEINDHLFRRLVSIPGVGQRCEVGRIGRSSG